MDYQENKNVEATGGRRTAPRLGRFVRTLKWATVCVVITAVLICGLMAAARIISLEKSLEDALRQQDTVAITNVRVKDRLVQIGDLSTASYEYENSRTIKDTRNIFGWSVPGTTSTVTLNYCGVVKIGYDVAQIQVRTDTDKQLILVALPEPSVKDNYIKLDGLACTSSNNLLNPIRVDDIPMFFEESKSEALLGAQEHNIFNVAEERMKELVIEFLAVFPDYIVVFE